MQAEGYSIDAQKELLASYCKIKGIEKYQYYIDAGYSGRNMNRPSLEKLKEDCREKTIGVVIVYKLDRLSRSQKDTLFLIEEVFIPNGVDFISISENFDTATPFGKAMIGILSVFAQLERETIRERTRMGMKERVKAGYFPGGGRLPYGYDYDRTKGILIPNERAEDVKKMYEMYLAGYSTGKIAEHFGLEYDSLVKNILKSKINCGIIEYNKTEYPALHEPIITRKMYDETMALMSKKGKNYIRPSENLLTGIIYCGVCGAKMRYQKWGNKGHKICCYSQQSDKSYMIKDKNCDNSKNYAEEVERLVIGELFKMSLDSSKITYESEKNKTDNYERIKRKTQENDKKISNLLNFIAKGIAVEETEEKILELKKENDELKKRLTEKNRSDKKLTAFREKIKGLSDVWGELDNKGRRAIVVSLVERVVITYDRIDIYYTFE